jgi:HlyD family secretion protein
LRPLPGPHPEPAQGNKRRPYSASHKLRAALRGPRFVAVVAFVAALGWGGYSWGLAGRKAVDVLSATVVRGDLVITVTDRGELESSQSVQVVCEVEGGGKLVTIVPEGTHVKKGDEVAKLDADILLKGINEQEVKWEQAAGKFKTATSELEVQKNKAESEIAKADLALILAKIDYDSYEEGEYSVELDKRKAAVEIGKKDLKEAEDGVAFTRGLVKKGFAQIETMRAKELEVLGKRYAVRQQEADLKVLTKFAKVRKLTELKAKAEDALRELARTKKSQSAATEKIENELKAAEKTAALEKRHLERLRGQLGKCVIKAPQEGIVIYFNYRYWDDSMRIRPGASVNFQQPFITLPDLSKMKVNLKVHESVVKTVHVGQHATMQVDALPNQLLHGRVVSVGTLAESDNWRGGGVKEYKTDVSIDDLPKEAGLRPGMTAEVKILIKTVKDALMVPVQAVTESGAKQVCYVVTPAGVEQREVKIGDSNQLYVQITEGLEEGERVALDARTRAAAELKAGNEPKTETKKAGDKETPKK